MIFKKLPFDFSIAHLKEVDTNIISKPFAFYANTTSEKSILCITKDMPKSAFDVTNGFKCLKLEGTFEFSIIGIASYVSTLFKNNGISLLVESTFDTDYFFVKEENYSKAIKALIDDGNEIKE